MGIILVPPDFQTQIIGFAHSISSFIENVLGEGPIWKNCEYYHFIQN
jgi:hypothetical protein